MHSCFAPRADVPGSESRALVAAFCTSSEQRVATCEMNPVFGRHAVQCYRWNGFALAFSCGETNHHQFDGYSGRRSKNSGCTLLHFSSLAFYPLDFRVALACQPFAQISLGSMDTMTSVNPTATLPSNCCDTMI